jgi:hypothetical protein
VFETRADWVRIMFGFTEELEVVKMRPVKVCTKTGILSSWGSKNLVFRQKLQRNCLRKGNSSRFKGISVKLWQAYGENYAV